MSEKVEKPESFLYYCANCNDVFEHNPSTPDCVSPDVHKIANISHVQYIKFLNEKKLDIQLIKEDAKNPQSSN